MSRPPVYLDYHATTPVDPRVLEVMLPYFTEVFGNPASSSHAWGWKAQEAVEQARREVAALIGAAAREIYFTSGATESNNLAIQGAWRVADTSRRHIVVSAIEHKSVLEGAQALERHGWRCTVAPVRRDGLIDLEALDAVVGPDTAFVSVMAANNEIGVVRGQRGIARRQRQRLGRLYRQPVEEIHRLHHGGQFMIPVRPLAEHVQGQVDLGGGADDMAAGDT